MMKTIYFRTKNKNGGEISIKKMLNPNLKNLILGAGDLSLLIFQSER